MKPNLWTQAGTNKQSNTVLKSLETQRTLWKKKPSPTAPFASRSGLRGLPPPPCGGDRDQRWSDQGSVALFLSFSPFIFLFCLLLAFRSGASELPSPPLSFPIFLFTSPSSDLSLYGRNLLEALGDSSLQRTPSLLATRICFSSGCQDLSQLRMFAPATPESFGKFDSTSWWLAWLESRLPNLCWSGHHLLGLLLYFSGL
uniref:Uncharacterized protein n=1 Tax=Fagus sylvatica TaxID=28930 RepID=A0A2N9HEY6_FAGSY